MTEKVNSATGNIDMEKQVKIEVEATAYCCLCCKSFSCFCGTWPCTRRRKLGCIAVVVVLASGLAGLGAWLIYHFVFEHRYVALTVRRVLFGSAAQHWKNPLIGQVKILHAHVCLIVPLQPA